MSSRSAVCPRGINRANGKRPGPPPIRHLTGLEGPGVRKIPSALNVPGRRNPLVPHTTHADRAADRPSGVPG